MELKQVYLLRHGETPWTLTGQHTGVTDLDLTQNGVREAELLGASLKKVHFDHLLCSPLLRARKTCKIAGYETVAEIDPDLVEWNYGDYEGKTTEEIRKGCPNWTIFTGDPPRGETAAEVGRRADRVIDKLLRLGGTIGVFSSGHFSRVLGARWVGLPVSAGQKFVLSTGSKSILGFEHGYRAIVLWNDISYIKR